MAKSRVNTSCVWKGTPYWIYRYNPEDDTYSMKARDVVLKPEYKDIRVPVRAFRD